MALCSEINWKWIFVHTVATILLCPTTLILILIILPVTSIPLLIIRWTIDKAAHSRRDFVGLGKMVNLMDSMYLRDAIYSNPKSNDVICFTVEGNMEIHKLREIFRDKVLNATLSNGSLKYHKLRQCLKPWCGYFFWNDVSNLDLEKQITFHTRNKVGETYNDEIISKTIEEKLNQAWVHGQPFWDITLVHNYQPGDSNQGQSYSCVLLTAHHINGDAFSLSCLVKDWLTIQNAPNDSVVHKVSIRTRTPVLKRIRRCLRNIVLPFRLAFHATEIVAVKLSFPLCWQVSKTHQTGKCWTQSTGPIPVKVIKDIKNHFGVSFTSVLWAIQVGAHREVLQNKGINPPELLSSAVSVLLPGHPDKMVNKSSCSLINLPVGEQDPVKRLLKCYEVEKNNRSSVSGIFCAGWVLFVGLLPPNFIKQFQAESMFTFITANISLSDLELYGDANSNTNPITKVVLISGAQLGTHGIFMTNVSYNGHIDFCTAVDQALMGKEESLQFSSAIINQINILHQLLNV